jgi:hypothetical protein
MSRVGVVLAYLESRGVAAAMIGGAALAVHGIARATLDIDFLTDDVRVLDTEFWSGLRDAPPPEIRRGDSSDPLVGVVRWNGHGDPIDIIVGRGSLTSEILSRRTTIAVGQRKLPVVDAPDLILLKLGAGGPQDLLDVRLMLHSDDGTWRAAVESRLSGCPQSVRDAWGDLRADRG